MQGNTSYNGPEIKHSDVLKQVINTQSEVNAATLKQLLLEQKELTEFLARMSYQVTIYLNACSRNCQEKGT